MYSEKFKNLVLYVLRDSNYIDEGIKKLNKILYFIDFYYYRDNERFISDVQYAKAGMGPLINGYKEIFKEMVNNGLLERKKINGCILHIPKDEVNLSVFLPEEIDHIRNILERYGKLSSVELESISHEQQPWILTKNDGDIIDPDLALLIDEGKTEEIKIENEQIKKELVALANKV